MAAKKKAVAKSKPVAKKPAAKKPAAKKPAAKKPAAKKSAVKKPAAKKAVTKKPAAKKPAAKKESAVTVSTMPKAGDAAPAFATPDENGNVVTLESLRGKNVVLYFYPKDSTPGCTLEGQQFSKLAAEFAAKNTVIYGVSADSEASHQKFKAKCGIGIPLLSDKDRTLLGAYGAYGEKVMYGKKMMGIIRSTFLIGPDGTVKATWPKVKADGHAAEVLAALG